MQYQTRVQAWAVDEDWRWITVVRKPIGLDGDGELLVRLLIGLVQEQSGAWVTADRLVGLMADLRLLYIKDKMG